MGTIFESLFFLSFDIRYPVESRYLNESIFSNILCSKYSCQIKNIKKITKAFCLLDSNLDDLEKIHNKLQDYVSLLELKEMRDKISTLKKNKYKIASSFIIKILNSIPNTLNGLKNILETLSIKSFLKKAIFA